MILFNTEEIDFSLPNEQSVIDWITKTISLEGKQMGDISYIFCSDTYLHKINVEYLKHDTYTDIITFDYTEMGIISSDIFISIDRVKENASTFNNSFNFELSRVIIHGILHLLGYKDKSEKEAAIMRSKEDFYLNLLSQ